MGGTPLGEVPWGRSPGGGPLGEVPQGAPPQGCRNGQFGQIGHFLIRDPNMCTDLASLSKTPITKGGSHMGTPLGGAPLGTLP